MKPLFMWAGGKTRLIRHYLPYMPKKVNAYIEPFFGAGAMFLHVMKTYKPRNVLINDINDGIVNIYRAIQTDVDAFTQIVDDYQALYLPLSKEDRKALYFAVRNEHAYFYQDWSETYEAAVLYFLMKTGFNGIFQINKNTNGRFGTPSGLLNQTTKIYDKDVVLHWHQILSGVAINSADWSMIPYPDEKDTFIFFDPPYRDSFTSYGQSFDDTQQQKLLDVARGFKQSDVFLSNRDAGDGFFDNISPLNKLSIPVTYTAGRRKRTVDGYEAKAAIEILLYNTKGK